MKNNTTHGTLKVLWECPNCKAKNESISPIIITGEISFTGYKDPYCIEICHSCKEKIEVIPI